MASCSRRSVSDGSLGVLMTRGASSGCANIALSCLSSSSASTSSCARPRPSAVLSLTQSSLFVP
eukprot:1557260-Heterocapsa_arctica.AAC.1